MNKPAPTKNSAIKVSLASGTILSIAFGRKYIVPRAANIQPENENISLKKPRKQASKQESAVITITI